jgi:hypothetical protein
VLSGPRGGQRVQRAPDCCRLENEAELGIVAGNDKIFNPDLERWY